MKSFFLILFSFLIFNTGFAQKSNSLVVLELFTSQGCSSCPKADDLLKTIGKNFPLENVITLSYHVDYWNYIGWNDPFSHKTFTKKQRAYSNKFYSSTIYTPQLVIDGKQHLVGSKQGLVLEKLKSSLNDKKPIALQIDNVIQNKQNINFNYSLNTTDKVNYLRAILVLEERTTAVKNGENRNRILKNANIVVLEEKIVPQSTSGSYSITIPEIVKKEEKLRLVLIAENNDLDTLGGTQIKL